MPLDKSGSMASIGKNINAEEGSGKPHKQAVAIALDVARRNGAKIPMKKGKKPNNTVRLKVESLADEDGTLMARLGPISREEPKDGEPMAPTPFVGCTIPIEKGEADYYQPGQHVEIHCIPVDGDAHEAEEATDDSTLPRRARYEKEREANREIIRRNK